MYVRLRVMCGLFSGFYGVSFSRPKRYETNVVSSARRSQTIELTSILRKLHLYTCTRAQRFRSRFYCTARQTFRDVPADVGRKYPKTYLTRLENQLLNSNRIYVYIGWDFFSFLFPSLSGRTEIIADFIIVSGAKFIDSENIPVMSAPIIKPKNYSIRMFITLCMSAVFVENRTPRPEKFTRFFEWIYMFLYTYHRV